MKYFFRSLECILLTYIYFQEERKCVQWRVNWNRNKTPTKSLSQETSPNPPPNCLRPLALPDFRIKSYTFPVSKTPPIKSTNPPRTNNKSKSQRKTKELKQPGQKTKKHSNSNKKMPSCQQYRDHKPNVLGSRACQKLWQAFQKYRNK